MHDMSEYNIAYYRLMLVLGGTVELTTIRINRLKEWLLGKESPSTGTNRLNEGYKDVQK